MNPETGIRDLAGPAVVALDLGTTWARCAVYDDRGRPVRPAWAKKPVEILSPDPGASEIDPGAWLESVCACLDKVYGLMGEKIGRVAGVGVCSLAGNIMGVDRDGRPTTPAFTYGDTRAQGAALALKTRLNEEEVRLRTGCPVHTAYLPARLLWLKKTRPDLFEKTARWISLGEFLERRLFGRTAVSVSMASWSGLLNRHTRNWDPEMMAVCGMGEDRLSPISPSPCVRKGLVPAFARRWPGLKDLPWFGAIGDGAAANLGCNCHDPGRVAVTIGTSSAIRMVTEKPVDLLMPGLWAYKVDHRRNLVGGALNEGGNLHQWLTRFLGGTKKVSEQAVFSQKPDAHGLTVLPFWAGERSVGWDGNARGTIHGLTLATSPEDLVRAVLEAVSLRLAEIFNRLVKTGATDPVVVAGGGALAASEGWRRILADALGRPLMVTGITEVSARGAAILALESLGIIPDAGSVPDFFQTALEPDMAAHEIYQKALERQNRLYNQMKREIKT